MPTSKKNRYFMSPVLLIVAKVHEGTISIPRNLWVCINVVVSLISDFAQRLPLGQKTVNFFQSVRKTVSVGQYNS